MYHLDSHWMDLYEILYWGLLIRKAVEHLYVSVQSNSNIWLFTWRCKTHILKSISNKLHNFSKIWHSNLLHPLSIAIFRKYQYLKSYKTLLYRLLIIHANIPILFFQSCTVHFDIIESFIYPADVQIDCSKRILKYTLKYVFYRVNDVFQLIINNYNFSK